MKIFTNHSIFFAAAILAITAVTPAIADEADGSSQSVNNAAEELAAGTRALYVVTYMRSRTSAPGSVTAISITNNTGSTCQTSVDWKIGFGGVACTTNLTLGPRQTGEHCSRALAGALAVCNATCSPELANTEGNAIVGSSRDPRACRRIAVSARTYYLDGSGDSRTVSAITDAKIVKYNAGNNGD